MEGWDEWLQSLGDPGYLLKIRFYSIKSAFANLPPAAEELEKWIKIDGFAERYAGLVEAKIHDSVVKRHRTSISKYSKWKLDDSTSSRDVFIPPHLVGQLVQHEFGLQLLLRRNIFQRFLRVIQRFRMEFGDNNEPNVRQPKEIRCGLEDSYMSEESAVDEMTESFRLETILDSEPADLVPEIQSPQKSNGHLLIHRKLSLDESFRMTPERNCKNEENREEQRQSIEGNLIFYIIRISGHK